MQVWKPRSNAFVSYKKFLCCAIRNLMWCAIKHVCVLKYLGHYLISIFWQIRNNLNPNSYHRHKGCAWFVPDLLRWRVSSCNVWIFPVVNNITSVLQYFPSTICFLLIEEIMFFYFCSPPVHTGEVVCGAELTVLHVHPVLLLGLRLVGKLIPLLRVILSWLYYHYL